MADSEQKRTGTQSIERTVLLMKAVSERGRGGWQLADIARYCELDKSTVHRILGSLVRARLVTQRPDGRYLPGPLVFEMALAMRPHHAFQLRAEERLKVLARKAHATASLYLRSGDETVCAFSVGEAATRNYLNLNIGSRRPLIASTAGIALLLAMPHDEAQVVIGHNLELLQRQHDARVNAYLAMYRDSQQAGIALHENHHMLAFNGYGTAVRDASGKAFASVVLSGSQEELPAARRSNVAALLADEAAALSAEAASLLGGVD